MNFPPRAAFAASHRVCMVVFINSLSLAEFAYQCYAMAPHSSVLAWRIPGTEEPGGLPSMGSHRVGHDK